MYNDKISNYLSKNSIKLGDYVRVITKDSTYLGLLLPRQSGGDNNSLIIKLDSGYNIGIKFTTDVKIQLIKKASAKNISIKTGGERMQKNSIHILSTGGTIAAKVDYKTGGVYPSISADELVNSYPRLEKLKPFSTKNIASIQSEDMNPQLWEKIAQEVKQSFDDDAQGIVITHGTDTMGYTAAALSYALENLPAPVVLTGAQKSPDRASSDAEQNIFCSLNASKSDFAEVCVCMHATSSDDYNNLHFATRVRKAHTSARWAFKSVGVLPFGKVDGQSGEVNLQSNVDNRDMSRKIKLKNKFSTNVHLAWSYPGITKETILSWLDYDGVVIGGTGLGHLPIDSDNLNSKTSILPAIKELISSGVLVAIAPQTLEGRLIQDTYSSGRILKDAGVIGNGADWLIETAYVKMCWVLGQTKDISKAKEMMMTPIHNDITDYSIVIEDED